MTTGIAMTTLARRAKARLGGLASLVLTLLLLAPVHSLAAQGAGGAPATDAATGIPAETAAYLAASTLTLADVGVDYVVGGTDASVDDGVFTYSVIIRRTSASGTGPLGYWVQLSTPLEGAAAAIFDARVEDLVRQSELTGRIRAAAGPVVGERTTWLFGQQEFNRVPADLHTVLFLAGDTVVMVSTVGFTDRASQQHTIAPAELIAGRLGWTRATAAVLTAPAAETAAVQPSVVADFARAEAHFDLGVRYFETNALQWALAEFDQAIEYNPGSAESYYWRGDTYWELERWQEALDDYDQAIKRQPDLAKAHWSRGWALARLDRFAEALDALAVAAELDPSDAAVPYGQADALFRLGDYAEAQKMIDRAIILSPDWAQAHFFRGRVLSRLEQPAEALASYDGALALRDNYPEAHHNRGLLLQTFGRDEEALTAHTRARDLRPGAPAFHYGRGFVLLRLGRDDEALVAVDQLLALTPQAADAHQLRGLVLARLGLYREAAEHLQYGAQRDPAVRLSTGPWLAVFLPDADPALIAYLLGDAVASDDDD